MALNFGKLNFSTSFNPTSAFPLDARSYFESYELAAAAAATAEEAGSSNTVYYYGENPLAVNMTLTTWDYEAQVGVCYSTSNDLPTLEQCDGVAQCPDTSVGYGVSSYYEFTLPAGTYYVRAYARSEGGLTYAPVQQITITENVTR